MLKLEETPTKTTKVRFPKRSQECLTACISISYKSYKFEKNDLLLFGRESAGVPKNIHEIADERLIIPMAKGLRSLNVSSSVAIVVGEACRQLSKVK